MSLPDPGENRFGDMHGESMADTFSGCSCESIIDYNTILAKMELPSLKVLYCGYFLSTCARFKRLFFVCYISVILIAEMDGATM